MRRVISLLKRLLPAETSRGQFVRRLIPGIRWSAARKGYRRYIRHAEPGLWSPRISADGASPLLCVVIPLFNTPERYLAPLLDSLTNQSFAGFEAVLADASTDPTCAAFIKMRAALDDRFRYLRLATNGGISANTNAAIALASAPYVVFVDHDDLLAREALNEVACRLSDDPTIDVLYSDEDLLSEDGTRRRSPAFKPEWSPHLLLHCNFTNHLSVIRRSLIDEVGGLRTECDGAQDFDLLLRLHDLGRPLNVAHIPLVLYHWREAASSTARSLGNKTYAVDAGRKAMAEHLRRVGVESAGIDVLPAPPGWLRVKPRWQVPVAVLGAGPAADSMPLLRGLTRNAVCAPQWISQPDGLDVSAIPGDAHAVVVFFQPFKPLHPDWLDDMVGALTIPGVTAVTPLLAGHDDVNDEAAFGALNPNIAVIRQLQAVGDTAFTWPINIIRDVPSIKPLVVAVRRDGLGLLDPLAAGESVLISPDQGYLVSWGLQRMTAYDASKSSKQAVGEAS
ncbi:MAG: glycosyltransferase [Propionibacteriaceae bacterium]|nr:glycosyltransferase [Propionibacteriaceae bacterium]